MQRQAPTPASIRRPQTQGGFTLIELLIAITLMAVLAGLSWRGLDNLMRSRDITQAQVDKVAVLQTVLAQWQADLYAAQALPELNEPGVNWDGRTLRITRQAPELGPGSDAKAALWVVAWTLRDNQWLRWQSPALQNRSAWQQAWREAARWGQTPSAEDAARQTTLIPVEAWQLTYFRGNAWVNPLSSAGQERQAPQLGTATGIGKDIGAAADAVTAVATAGGGGAPSQAQDGNEPMPDAIRLYLDLPASSGLRGRITLDWVRPNFSNTKT